MTTDNVTELPLSDFLRPEQALAEALKDVDKMESVMIIGITKDERHFAIHSQVARDRALYILEHEKFRVMAPSAWDSIMNETGAS